MNRLNSNNGIGLLGISGKYGEVTIEHQETALEYILRNYDFIDTASVYGEQWSINPVLVRIAKDLKRQGQKLPILINKIGADLIDNQLVDNLINEYKEQQIIFKDYPIDILLLHRPHINLVERDTKFYDYLRRKKNKISFGISTNNINVLKAYNTVLPLEYVQIAINLLDYRNNLEILEYCNKENLYVQARSVLSSGLLSGKYSKNKTLMFTDALRARFTNCKKNKAILYSRLDKAEEIKELYQNYVEKNSNISMSSFVYSLTNSSPFINIVIKGGSSIQQIKDNSDKHIINDNLLIERVYSSLYKDFSTSYL